MRKLLILMVAIVASALVGMAPNAFSAEAACPSGSTLNIVAHEDDDLLFLNPDILKDIKAGVCERTVYVTAGDANLPATYWQGREKGILAAYSTMAGVANDWTVTSGEPSTPGRPAPLFTIKANPRVSVMFMHLPDGFRNGAGASNNNFNSLQKLYEDKIPSISTVAGAPAPGVYTKQGLVAALGGVMTDFKPGKIRTQDFTNPNGPDDHSDHRSVAFMVRDANSLYIASHILVAYQDYTIFAKPENVTGPDLAAKTDAWNAYVKFDAEPCGSPPNCGTNDYAKWLSRRYELAATGAGGTAATNAPQGKPSGGVGGPAVGVG